MNEEILDTTSKVRAYLRPKIEAMEYLYTPPVFQFPHQFSWLKRLSPSLGAYVLVTDGRKRGNNVQVHLWVAPICLPSDLFERLELGTVNILLNSHQATTEIMDQVVKKLSYFEVALPSLRQVAERDLDNPCRLTSPLLTFTWKQKAFEVLRNKLTAQEWQDFREIVEGWMAKTISGEHFTKSVFELVRPKLSAFIEQYPAEDLKMVPRLIGGGIGMLQAAHMMFDGEFARKPRMR